MQGSEMKQIRERLGMSRLQFARALGYTGTDRNDEMRIRRYENNPNGEHQIPLYIARLAWLIDQAIRGNIRGFWQMEDGRVIGFPDWPGYEFEHTPDHEVAK